MSNALKDWLDGFGLGRCAGILAAHEVDFDVLPDLVEHDLEKIGLPLGERKRLLRAIGTLGAASTPAHSAPAGAAAPGPERRRLTVMFCDLVGSTELAARLDPEDFHTVIAAHLAAIADGVGQYGGFVARYYGDGLLAYFGWPRASDNDAELAASAALAVLARVAACDAPERMRVRVGVATGLVVVGDIVGQGPAREFVVSGETPNLAARLQAAAEPGTALLAAETRVLVGDVFTFGEKRPLTLKGFARPVEAWPLTGEREGAHRTPLASRGADSRIVGRQQELDWLLARWREAIDGAGRVLVLVGEPGIGKSSIAEALAAGIAERHALLRVQCLQRRSDSSLYPIAMLLRQVARFEPEDSDEVRRAKLALLLEDDAEQARRPDPARLALLASLLDLPGQDLATLYPDPRALKAALLATLADTIASQARFQPLLLLVEDIHWADATTLELLEILAERLASRQAVMLILTRPGFLPSWERVDLDVRIIGPLAADEGASVMAQVARKPLPPDVAREILRKSDGVPLFIEELTRAVLESGCLEEGDEAYTLVAPMAALAIPATLNDSLLARLDRLGWVKEIAQLGAVVGREFSPALVAAMSNFEAHRLEAGLRQLVNSGLVGVGDGTEAMYSFRHALLHDAAYGTLLHSARRTLHGRLASVLLARQPELAREQPEILAHHYTEAHAHEEAADWWQRAGDRAARRWANVEAVAHFSRALEALENWSASAARDLREFELRRSLGAAQIEVYGFTAALLRENVDRVMALTDRLDDPGRQFPALGGHFGSVYWRGEMAQALQAAWQILRLAERMGQRPQRMLAHWLVGMALSGVGELEAAETQLRASLALANPDEDAAHLRSESSDRVVGALAYLALVHYLRGNADEALASDAAALARARQLDHPGTLTIALVLHASLLVLRGESAALGAAAGELAEVAARKGSRHAQLAAEAFTYLRQAEARPDEALFAAVRERIRTLRSISWNVIVTWTTLKEIEVCLAHGRNVAARASVDELSEMFALRGYDILKAEMLRLRAVLAHRDGAPADEMTRLLGQAIAVARAQSAVLLELRAALSWVELAGHDAGEGREALAAACARLPAGCDLPELQRARRLLDSAARGRREMEADVGRDPVPAA